MPLQGRGLSFVSVIIQKAMEQAIPNTVPQTSTEDLTREQRLELEEKAIEALIEMGVKFSVPLKLSPKKMPKMYAWWNTHFPGKPKIWRDDRIPKGWNVSQVDVPDPDSGTMKTVYMRNFHIKPLYLGTIDALRRLYLEIEYNEEKIQDEPIQESKKLFKYIPLMCEIAAVAVINSPTVTDPISKEVSDLKAFFLEHLNVTRLRRLAEVISQMMNAGGFTSSIRLIREIGTTKPIQNRANLVE